MRIFSWIFLSECIEVLRQVEQTFLCRKLLLSLWFSGTLAVWVDPGTLTPSLIINELMTPLPVLSHLFLSLNIVGKWCKYMIMVWKHLCVYTECIL